MDLSKRADTPAKAVRSYPVQLEVRAKAGGKTTVEGYASVTEAPYEMYDMFGSYEEVIRSGAFTKTLSENPQVQLLLNHRGLSMAYTKAGTLRLAEDDTGLHIEAEVNSARSDVKDMLTALTDGDVDEMSFAFQVMRQMWSPDWMQRDITEVSMHRGDVSVVNFGANDATSAWARSMNIEQLADAEARALLRKLEARFAIRQDPTPTVPAREPEPQSQRHPLSLYEAEALLLG